MLSQEPGGYPPEAAGPEVMAAIYLGLCEAKGRVPNAKKQSGTLRIPRQCAFLI
jgi:hypothetical protein